MSEPDAALLNASPGRIELSGPLDFETVARLLELGEAAIARSPPEIRIDLAKVSDSDSAGLALLLEWLSLAKSSERRMHFDNVPQQLLQLARLSDLESLLTG